MIPLYSTSNGDKVKIIKMLSNDKTKKHLNELGFVEGTHITIISSHKGDIIVNIKDSRIVVTKELSEKIMIEFLD